MTLPTWGELSDLDKGAALLHLWKKDWEGDRYARREYPAKFLADERLRALNRDQANDYADSLGDYASLCEQLGQEEADRLYDLALEHERSDDG